jgi:hypothetical protein
MASGLSAGSLSEPVVSPMLFSNAAVCLVSSRPLPQAVLQVQLRACRPSPSLQKLIPPHQPHPASPSLTQPHPVCTLRAHACNTQRTVSCSDSRWVNTQACLSAFVMQKQK